MSEDHYFSADPSVPFKRAPVEATVWGHDLRLTSGSGVFARDPDSIITMTAHEKDDCFSIEMTLRNLPPQDPFVVRRSHPLLLLENQLDPSKLKKPRGRHLPCPA